MTRPSAWAMPFGGKRGDPSAAHLPWGTSPAHADVRSLVVILVGRTWSSGGVWVSSGSGTRSIIRLVPLLGPEDDLAAGVAAFEFGVAGVSWLAVHGAAWETVAEPENLG